jgi:hypothetical protein
MVIGFAKQTVASETHERPISFAVKHKSGVLLAVATSVIGKITNTFLMISCCYRYFLLSFVKVKRGLMRACAYLLIRTCSAPAFARASLLPFLLTH